MREIFPFPENKGKECVSGMMQKKMNNTSPVYGKRVAEVVLTLQDYVIGNYMIVCLLANLP